MPEVVMLKLTHANLRQEILVYPDNVFVVYQSEANKCTHIVSTHGYVAPVLEDVEFVNKAVISAKAQIEAERTKFLLLEMKKLSNPNESGESVSK